MRHQKSGRKLGRNSAHRKAMFRNMVTSLFEHGSIRTTDARAKELRPIGEAELADVLIYALRLADVASIDLEAAIEEKLKLNAEKYPPGEQRQWSI